VYRYAVALGSNLGDRLQHLRQGVARLRHGANVQGLVLSRIYETEPVGGPLEQEAYLNAAAVFFCSLEPAALLALLLHIEEQEGRVRLYPNSPRTLDLDLLLCDGLELELPGLTLPHPRMHLRAFVLAPLAEIAPDWVVPGRGSVAALLARVGRAGVRPTDLRW